MFHEKQYSAYCGQHALNNLFQEKKFISNDNDKDCLINVNGQFNLKAWCKYLEPLLEERCSDQSGNYIVDSILGAIDWFGFRTQLIDLEHEDQEMDLDDGITYKEHCYNLLRRNMEEGNMLGCIIRHNVPDHYTCFIKNNDTYRLIESRIIEDVPVFIDLDGDSTIEFLKGGKQWPNGFSGILQIICVFITDDSYKCVSSGNRGSEKAYGNLYKERFAYIEEAKEKVKQSHKDCLVPGCGFNCANEVIIAGIKHIIKPDDKKFCSVHHNEFLKLKSSGFADDTAIQIVIRNQPNMDSSSSGRKSKCLRRIRDTYTKRRKIIKDKENICMARLWKDGCGLPCLNKGKTGEDFCGTHLKKNEFGRIDEDRPSNDDWLDDSIYIELIDPDSGIPYPLNSEMDNMLLDDDSMSSSSKKSSRQSSRKSGRKSSKKSSGKSSRKSSKKSHSMSDDSSDSELEVTIFQYKGDEYLVDVYKNVYKETYDGHTYVGKLIDDTINFNLPYSD